jgi:hypothetical protein
LLKFERHKPGQQSRRIKLAEDRLQIGETAGVRMQRRDVAIAGRRQGDEAEVDQFARDDEIAFDRAEPGECVRHHQSHEAEQRDKDQSDIEI